MSTWGKLAAKFVGACALVLTPLAVTAEWQLVEEQVPYNSSAKASVAIVKSEQGDSFRVYVDDNDNVRGVLSLRGGFDAFEVNTCPTYQIDDRAPQIVSFASGLCELEAATAHFSFGAREGRQIRSTALHRLMNGRSVVFRFRLSSVGYRESTFSLSRSKFAVEGAVGAGVRIEKQ